MNNEEKRQHSTEKIIEATVSLFVEQGYDKTTMRQISHRCGLLIGSVYNIFESKEDILLEIMRRAYHSAMVQIEKTMIEKEEPLAMLAFPLSVYLHSECMGEYTPEILYAASQSWKVTSMFIEKIIKWMSGYFDSHNIPYSRDDMYRKLVAVFGSVSAYLSHKYHTKTSDHYNETVTVMKIVCNMFNFPTDNIENIVKDVIAKLEGYHIVFSGANMTFEQA